MKYRIGIAGIFHETNTYAATTTLQDFQIWRGQEIIDANTGARTYIGGMLDGCGECGFEIVPLMYAEATPSGPIQQDAYLSMRDEILTQIREHRLDGLLLAIHGAGVAENIHSIEENFCASVRQLTGNDFPVAAILDLHGNLPVSLPTLCSALFPGQYNPHTDQHERGMETAICLQRMLEQGLKPQVHIEQIPLQFPPVPTSLPAFVELDALCTQFEAQPGVLCVRLMHGFPYADVPDAGASVVVTTDSSQADAEIIAQQVAQAFWQRRFDIRVTAFPAAEAVALAVQSDSFPVLINEFSDNTGAGTPGDGTHLLRALLDANVHACFSHIFDTETVLQAAEAGVGSEIEVCLGGKHIALHGDPICTTAKIMALSDGLYRVKSPMGTGEVINLGQLATLRIGKVDVIVSSGRRQTLDDGPYIKAGIDYQDYPLIALKSSQHFRAWYTPRVAQIITADSPGLSCVDLSQFQRIHATRQCWPLNTEVTYPTQLHKKSGE